MGPAADAARAGGGQSPRPRRFTRVPAGRYFAAARFALSIV
jgi:hypothetical protein